jgi:hypothetical protein
MVEEERAQEPLDAATATPDETADDDDEWSATSASSAGSGCFRMEM